MIKTSIPQSVLDILDIFIELRFPQLPYKSIASKLDLKVDTLIQRISRNKEYFDIYDQPRPTLISVKKGLKEIYFYRDKNICKICGKVFSPNKLQLKLRNPALYDKYSWNNVISVCNHCEDEQIIKKVKNVKQEAIIEYKEISIDTFWQKNPESGKNEYFFEFDEHDGRGFFPLIDENGKIASKTVSDILNYFYTEGWKVIHIERIEEEYQNDSYQVFFKRKKGVN